MKLYIYKNGLCDPARDIGIAKEFLVGKDLDDYVDLFCASIDPKYISNWRIFITNNEVSFAAVDHFVLMDEHYGLDQKESHIQEVDVKAKCLEVNIAVKARHDRLEEARNAAEKVV